MAAPKTATKKKATLAKKAPAAKKPAAPKAKKAAAPPKKKFAVKKTLAAAKKKVVKKPIKTKATKKTTARKAPTKKAPAAATKAAKVVAKKTEKGSEGKIIPVPLYPGNPWFSMTNVYYLSAFDVNTDLSTVKCITAPANPKDQDTATMEDKAQLPSQLWAVKHHQDDETGNTFSFTLQQTCPVLYLAPLKGNKVGVSVTEYKWHLEYTHVVGASGTLKNWPLPTFLWVDTTRDKAIQRDGKTGQLTMVTSAPDKIAQHFHMSELEGVKPVPLYPGKPWFSTTSQYYLSAFDVKKDLSTAKCMTADTTWGNQKVTMEDKAQLSGQLWTVTHLQNDTYSGNTFVFQVDGFYLGLFGGEVTVLPTPYFWRLEYTHAVGASGVLKNWPIPAFVWLACENPGLALQRDGKGKLTAVSADPTNINQHFHMSEYEPAQ